MAPRGLSAEEKRVKLLEIFHETKDFYQLKELEKLGPKMRGIVSQSVKEVLQSLVDDGLVQADKIGSSNFYWSFPSQRAVAIQARLSTAKETRINLQKQLEEVGIAIELEKSARPESENRYRLLEKLAVAKRDSALLEQELSAYGSCDPAKLEGTRRAVRLAKEAAVRWTENYGMLQSYFTRQTGMDAQEIRQYLGVEDDYEDIC